MNYISLNFFLHMTQITESQKHRHKRLNFYFLWFDTNILIKKKTLFLFYRINNKKSNALIKQRG